MLLLWHDMRTHGQASIIESPKFMPFCAASPGGCSSILSRVFFEALAVILEHLAVFTRITAITLSPTNIEGPFNKTPRDARFTRSSHILKLYYVVRHEQRIRV